jgi:hypothetical protein
MEDNTDHEGTIFREAFREAKYEMKSVFDDLYMLAMMSPTSGSHTSRCMLKGR